MFSTQVHQIQIQIKWHKYFFVFVTHEMRDCYLVPKTIGFTKGKWNSVLLQFYIYIVELSIAYRHHHETRVFMGRLWGLSFLPEDIIPVAYESVRQLATNQQHKQLAAYFSKQWLENPQFPPRNWSVFKKKIRTNNNMEGIKQNVTWNITLIVMKCAKVDYSMAWCCLLENTCKIPTA